jgi:hypothetical protein
VIITEPSNPWTAGIGSVFTLEFYELAAKRLKPGGIILQWFHIYENNDGLVAMVLRTVGRVFPHMEIWDCGAGDVLIMASQRPWDSSPEALRAGFSRPEVKKDMEALGILSPEALLLRQLASQRTAFAIAAPQGPIQTDMYPILEYESPKAFFLGGMAHLLNTFDERMRQERNAPAEKRKVLSSLKPEEIGPVFANYLSVNGDLLRYLAWHLRPDQVMAEARKSYEDTTSIIRASAPPSKVFEPQTNATETVTNVLYARWLIDSGRVREGAAIIERLLADKKSGTDWYPVSYAAFAAEACMQAGENRKAGEILVLALERAPMDAQLLYLANIVQREIIMSQARKKLSSLN